MLWGVVDFKPRCQGTGLRGRKRHVETGDCVRIQPIHHEPYFARVGIIDRQEHDFMKNLERSVKYWRSYVKN